jgi:hypothetical protein
LTFFAKLKRLRNSRAPRMLLAINIPRLCPVLLIVEEGAKESTFKNEQLGAALQFFNHSL